MVKRPLVDRCVGHDDAGECYWLDVTVFGVKELRRTTRGKSCRILRCVDGIEAAFFENMRCFSKFSIVGVSLNRLWTSSILRFDVWPVSTLVKLHIDFLHWSHRPLT